MCAVRNDRYPHVFSPLKIRGVTLKNRLEYSPTVVLKCTPEGDVTEEMLDYVQWSHAARIFAEFLRRWLGTEERDVKSLCGITNKV